MIPLEQLSEILSNYGLYAYSLLFVLSFAETLIGIGFFIYGELIFLPAGALAGAGVLDIWLVSISLVLGGIVGDTVSYWLGLSHGARFLDNKWAWVRTAFEKGKEYFDKYGPKAVFFARFLGPLSWVTPFLAGTYKMPYRQFITYNVPAVILGIGQFIIIGYVFGQAYQYILPKFQFLGDIFLIALVISIVVYQLHRYFRAKNSN